MNLNIRVMHALARLLDDETKTKQKTLVKAAPVLRLGTAFLCILLCAFSHNLFYTSAVIVFELARLSIMNGEALKRVVKKTGTAAVFSLLITLPAALLGSPGSMGVITTKVIEAVLVLSILNEILSWKEITGSFEALHVPGIFVLVLDMTIRFLILLGRYSNSLSEAVVLRAVGKKNWKDSHIGGILGTTFLKAQRMASETSEAMECRGFAGKYQIYQKHFWSYQDVLYLVLPVVLVVFFLYTESVL